VILMSERGKIIEDILNTPEIVAAREHNKKIKERERKVGRFIGNTLQSAYVFIPALALAGGFLNFASSTTRKINIAVGNLKAENYTLAKEQMNNLGQPELETLVLGMESKELSPERVFGYGKFHHPEHDMTVTKVMLSSNPSTSLGYLKASDGADFLVVGTVEGGLYFFNESFTLKTFLEEVQGEIYTTKDKDYVVVGSKKGGVYKFGVEALREGEANKTYEVLFNTITDVHMPIGEIRAYDLNGHGISDYFFSSTKGEIFGFNLEGEKIFHTEEKSEKDLNVTLPPTVVSLYGDGRQYVLHHLNDKIHIHALSGEKQQEITLDGELQKEILVGDLRGQGYNEIVVSVHQDDDTNTLLFSPSCHPKTELESCNWISHKIEKTDTFSYWKMQDLDADGLPDLVYGHEKKLRILFGDKVVPLTSILVIDESNALQNHWQQQNSFYAVPQSIPTEPPVALKRRKVNLDLHSLAPLLDFEYADSKISGKRIFRDRFNGKTQIAVVMEDNAYLMDDYWNQMDKPNQ